MSDIEWGAPIAVDGVRPAWLRDDERCNPYWSRNPADEWYTEYGEGALARNVVGWDDISKIRLPATHPAYLAIAKGFEPWAGGDSAPGDWDGGEVLLRGCHTFQPDKVGDQVWVWEPENDPRDMASEDCIGYKKRQAEDVSDDTVMVKSMTENEVRDRFEALWLENSAADSCVKLLQEVGVIPTPYTQAENIAQKTGLTVDQVQSVLNEVSHGTR